MKSDISYFESNKDSISKLINDKEKFNNTYSSLRLASFVILLIFSFLFVKNHFSLLFLVLAILFLAVFVVLCVFHSKNKRILDHQKVLLKVNDNYISRINGDFGSLSDKGDEFFDKNHDYALDLDVVGQTSLFALYNISHTALGRIRFADLLLGNKKVDDISRVQTAIKEFLNKKDFLIEYEATAFEGKFDKVPNALFDLSKKKNLFKSSHRTLYKFMPLLWLVPCVLFVLGSKFALSSAILICVINLIISFVISSKYVENFKSCNGISKQTEYYSKLYELLENETFENEYINSLIKGGAKDDHKASYGLNVLSKVCSLVSWRSQPLLALILNAIFPFDLLCADKLSRWCIDFGDELQVNLESLSVLEGIMCATVPGIISRESVFPDVSEGAFFEGENITHPLLNPSKAVSNSITLNSQLALITGSNMSGKTTLIRTIGICSILAYIGSPVPASKCSLGRMRVVSSMRIVDSLEEQMSTFRAELVRIGKIIEASKDSKPMMFLIDEIFRGTNSADRTDGALAVLQNLNKPYITGLMTTHDYALCDRVNDVMNSVVYYHFSEEYNNNEILFDYKLHNGVSHDSNAKYLMRLVGIET